MNKMKVITIKQPYATLIAEGLKQYEFRTWKTNFRGEILIHAGKGVNKEEMKKYPNLEFPSGCIIASVNITDCIKVDDSFRKQLKKENELVYYHQINSKDDNIYAFKLENVKKLKQININGKLSLWDYEGSVEYDS